MRLAVCLSIIVFIGGCTATQLPPDAVPTYRTLGKFPFYDLEDGVVYYGNEVIPREKYDKVYRLRVGGVGNPIQSLDEAGLPLLAFPNLMELDLSYNHFYSFPKGLGELETLKRLNMKFLCAHAACEQSLYADFEFPEEFFGLHTLKKLTVSYLSPAERQRLERKLPALIVEVENED